MRYQRIMAVALTALGLGLSGCAAALVGAGVAGGYAISQDSVKNHYDHSQSRVYRSSLTVVKKMGEVMAEDSKKGLIRARVKEADVTITVKPLTSKTVELEVQARNKFKMPAIDIAQEVYNEIDDRLGFKKQAFQ